MSNCIFCDIVNDKSEGTFVCRDEKTSAFMDIQPVTTGHVLIVPNEHATNLAELNPEVGAQMFRVAQKMAEALRRSELKNAAKMIKKAIG